MDAGRLTTSSYGHLTAGGVGEKGRGSGCHEKRRKQLAAQARQLHDVGFLFPKNKKNVVNTVEKAVYPLNYLVAATK